MHLVATQYKINRTQPSLSNLIFNQNHVEYLQYHNLIQLSNVGLILNLRSNIIILSSMHKL